MRGWDGAYAALRNAELLNDLGANKLHFAFLCRSMTDRERCRVCNIGLIVAWWGWCCYMICLHILACTSLPKNSRCTEQMWGYVSAIYSTSALIRLSITFSINRARRRPQPNSAAHTDDSNCRLPFSQEIRKHPTSVNTFIWGGTKTHVPVLVPRLIEAYCSALSSLLADGACSA